MGKQEVQCLFGYHTIRHSRRNEFRCDQCGLLLAICTKDVEIYNPELLNGYFIFIDDRQLIVFSNQKLSRDEAEKLEVQANVILHGE